MVAEDVYCTLVLSDAYLPGAAVLAHSLRDVGTQKKLVCLITPDSLQHSTIVALQSVYDYVIPVDRQSTPRPANLYVMNRPDLLFTFTKLNLWKLVQFRKIVYIDADVVALRAPDELFDTPEAFAAVSDVGWPDIFNTGVMVITPNMGEYHALQAMASAGDSFDGADQGLLNQYYEHRPWKRLSFGYNCTPSANYQYEPAYRYYKSSISLAHFIGLVKPWQASKDTAQGSAYAELLSRWWAVYDRHLSEYPVDQRSEAAQGEQRMQLATATPGDYKDRCEPCTESQEHYSTQEALQQPAEQLKTPAVAESAPKPPANPPSSDWNATLTAPSPGSQPEAANLDIETYVFSEDPGLFQPPADCSVSRSSKTATEKPPWMSPPRTPIFPWEERADAVVPQRRFSEAVSEPLSKADSEGEYSDSDFAGADELEVQCDDKPRGSKRRGAPERQGLDTSLGQVNSNAWDGIEGIDAYVRDLTIRQRRRLHRQQTLTRANQPRGPELIEAVNRRRESLKVTDFPTESERPSLPVTPAPRHRQPYWGVDRDPMEDLPPAEGVPHQSEWNPEAQLERLRRDSLRPPVNNDGKPACPDRKMPPTAVALPGDSKSGVPTATLNKQDVSAPLPAAAVTSKVEPTGGAHTSTPARDDTEEVEEESESSLDVPDDFVIPNDEAASTKATSMDPVGESDRSTMTESKTSDNDSNKPTTISASATTRAKAPEKF